jgi:hypothetical protein
LDNGEVIGTVLEASHYWFKVLARNYVLYISKTLVKLVQPMSIKIGRE